MTAESASAGSSRRSAKLTGRCHPDGAVPLGHERGRAAAEYGVRPGLDQRERCGAEAASARSRQGTGACAARRARTRAPRPAGAPPRSCRRRGPGLSRRLAGERHEPLGEIAGDGVGSADRRSHRSAAAAWGASPAPGRHCSRVPPGRRPRRAGRPRAPHRARAPLGRPPCRRGSRCRAQRSAAAAAAGTCGPGQRHGWRRRAAGGRIRAGRDRVVDQVDAPVDRVAQVAGGATGASDAGRLSSRGTPSARSAKTARHVGERRREPDHQAAVIERHERTSRRPSAARRRGLGSARHVATSVDAVHGRCVGARRRVRARASRTAPSVSRDQATQARATGGPRSRAAGARGATRPAARAGHRMCPRRRR